MAMCQVEYLSVARLRTRLQYDMLLLLANYHLTCPMSRTLQDNMVLMLLLARCLKDDLPTRGGLRGEYYVLISRLGKDELLAR